YWDSADLRLALRLNGSNSPITNGTSPTGVYVMNSDESVNTAQTQSLHSCSGNISGRVVGASHSFYNNRESTLIRMNEIDMRSLLNCLHSTDWLGTGKQLSDDTDGGIVFHFTVKGPDSGALPNDYGVRVRNASQLQS